MRKKLSFHWMKIDHVHAATQNTSTSQKSLLLNPEKHKSSSLPLMKNTLCCRSTEYHWRYVQDDQLLTGKCKHLMSTFTLLFECKHACRPLFLHSLHTSADLHFCLIISGSLECTSAPSAPDKSSHNFFSRHTAFRHKIYKEFMKIVCVF